MRCFITYLLHYDHAHTQCQKQMLKSSAEAETKSHTPTPSQPPDQFGYHFKYMTMSKQEMDVQNLV